MHVGVPKEIKPAERRVGMTPASVRELSARGHTVTVETQAGSGVGASDDDYTAAGATIANDAATIWAEADMVIKVKEPQAPERAQLQPGQILFTYLHLAPDPEQTADLVKSDAICVAYETVTDAKGTLPLLAPMSQVAGRLAVQAGAHCLESVRGGSGILLGGVPGVQAADVVVIGGGVVGENAIEMAVGLGAHVWVLDRNVSVLDRLDQRFGSALQTIYSTTTAIEHHTAHADLVIGAVLVRGSRAPHLVTRQMVADMKAGSVIVDVAIDQGGCVETAHPTTHAEPTYLVDDVVHYCVANMPGAVPRTSTYALNNVTLPFALALADKGTQALLENQYFLGGLNVCRGSVTDQAVAEALGYSYVDPREALAG